MNPSQLNPVLPRPCKLDFSIPSIGGKRPIQGESPRAKRRIDEHTEGVCTTTFNQNNHVHTRNLNLKTHNIRQAFDDQSQPILINGGKQVQHITIGNRDLQITKLELVLDSTNKNHSIYEFVPNQSDLEIHTKEISEAGEVTTRTKTINLAQTILKTPSPNKNQKVKTKLLTDTVNAIYRLEKDGVPLAEVYAHPGNFVDPENEKNGGFYLVKRMTTSIRSENLSKGIQNPLTDAVVLAFVKEWITKSANDKRIYIADFRADNVMKDEEGKVFVVDPDLSTDKQDFKEILYGTVKHWAGKSRQYFLTLIEDFEDATLKEKMVSWYDQGFESKHCVKG